MAPKGESSASGYTGDGERRLLEGRRQLKGLEEQSEAQAISGSEGVPD
jgi:hypothetical protein